MAIDARMLGSENRTVGVLPVVESTCPSMLRIMSRLVESKRSVLGFPSSADGGQRTETVSSG
jgi:hypothetical protein